MIDTQTITSAKSGNAYTLYFYEGKLKGCSCPRRKFHPREECPHMKQHKDEQRSRYNYYCLSMGI